MKNSRGSCESLLSVKGVKMVFQNNSFSTGGTICPERYFTVEYEVFPGISIIYYTSHPLGRLRQYFKVKASLAMPFSLLKKSLDLWEVLWYVFVLQKEVQRT